MHRDWNRAGSIVRTALHDSMASALAHFDESVGFK